MPASPLNLEPSIPEEREEHHLPPKSYADAAEEGLENGHSSGNSAPEMYAGQGEDAAPRSPRRNMHKKSGSLRMNGHTKDKSSNIIVERFQDKDGEHLVSFGPGWDNERNKPLAARRRNSELLSGRKAGARWEQSQYEGCGSYMGQHSIDESTASISPPCLFH